jgi:YD repeat-containing protein
MLRLTVSVSETADNRQTSMTDPLGKTETYAYEQPVDGQRQQHGHVHHDLRCRQPFADAIRPFGLTITYGYDGNGNVLSEQDSAGGMTTYTYDADNRQTSEQFNDGSTQLRVDSTYDGDGNILTQTRYANLAGTELVGQTVNTYDADDRMTQIVDKDASANVIEDFQTTYDTAGLVTTEVEVPQKGTFMGHSSFSLLLLPLASNLATCHARPASPLAASAITS